MNYIIHSLKVGSIFYYRGGFTSNQEEYTKKEEFPILIFLIQGIISACMAERMP